MPRLFGVDIPRLIHQNISPGILPATLTKVTQGTRSSAESTSGQRPTTQDIPCRAVTLEYTEREKAAGIVQAGDRKILITALSLQGGAVPEPNDQITIEGETYRIALEGVNRDPATASYECRARR